MVISRRALLGTGVTAAVVAGALTVADLTHRLDDLAAATGVNPRPKPDSGDNRLLTNVAADQDAILAAVEATAARHTALPLDPFVAIGRDHVEAVGGSSRVPAPPKVATDEEQAVAALANTYATASTARAADAGRAVSPDLARVLSSMSAGLAQCAQAIGAMR